MATTRFKRGAKQAAAKQQTQSKLVQGAQHHILQRHETRTGLPTLTVDICEQYTPITYYTVKKILYHDAECLSQFFFTHDAWHGSRVYARGGGGSKLAHQYVDKVGSDRASIAFPRDLTQHERKYINIGDVGVLVLAHSKDRHPWNTQNYLWGRCSIVFIGNGHFIVQRLKAAPGAASHKIE